MYYLLARNKRTHTTTERQKKIKLIKYESCIQISQMCPSPQCVCARAPLSSTSSTISMTFMFCRFESVLPYEAKRYIYYERNTYHFD